MFVDNVICVVENGKLEVNELLDNMHILHAHSQNREELIHAFKVFDKNKDGFIRSEKESLSQRKYHKPLSLSLPILVVVSQVSQGSLIDVNCMLINSLSLI